MKITVIGSDYVGRETGACLADGGHDVFRLDVDAAKVEHLNQGDVPVYEPGLKKLVALNIGAARVAFTTDDALRDADALVIVTEWTGLSTFADA